MDQAGLDVQEQQHPGDLELAPAIVVGGVAYLTDELVRLVSGSTLRRQRERLGISQTELARRVGMPRKDLSDVELGGRRATPDEAALLAEFLADAVGDEPFDLVGPAEACEIIGFTRQRLNVVLHSHVDHFPEPVAMLNAGNVWCRADVVYWARRHHRPGGHTEPPCPPSPFRPAAEQLVGSAEIAAMFGVTRQRVHAIVSEALADPFPQPIATLVMGRLWRRVDVERWMAKHRRPAARKR